MSDIIKLLPDSIANQIAAGEVIQRPASVVKELLENSIDAGSTEIKIIIKNAGKTLIQIMDNGKGMSETDARMCFERHATSKIRSAADLFKINTMGFRGEALASIASIAHVEMLTKMRNNELGTKLIIKGSKLESQEPSSSNNGTNILIRNLFYNVPARRKFLKSDPTELKHISDEFIRIALAHPEIHFVFYHNENELYHLTSSNLRQRIVSIFGKGHNEKLVPVEEKTDWIVIDGYVGKAESAKRTKGEQFLFVNKRFIKSNYINHAIKSAYEELIPKENYPLYVLFIQLDPEKIDINVHPTKQEIKFEEERLIYNYVKVAVRHAIGKYTLTPVIDFDENLSNVQFDGAIAPKNFNSALAGNGSSTSYPPKKTPAEKANLANWESVYDGLKSEEETEESAITFESKLSGDLNLDEKANSRKRPSQIQKSFILSQIKSGLIVIDQQAAHERILFEAQLKSLASGKTNAQSQLFEDTVELDTAKSEVLISILDKINGLGFEINDFGNNTFVIRSLPIGFRSDIGIKEDIELLIEMYLENMEIDNHVENNIAKSIALKSCIRRGKSLEQEEMQDLIDQLFACESPYKSPSGRKCFITIELEEIKKRFNVE